MWVTTHRSCWAQVDLVFKYFMCGINVNFQLNITARNLYSSITGISVVVMPRTILPRRNRRRALSATGMSKLEEEKDVRGVTCFMEENEISGEI